MPLPGLYPTDDGDRKGVQAATGADEKFVSILVRNSNISLFLQDTEGFQVVCVFGNTRLVTPYLDLVCFDLFSPTRTTTVDTRIDEASDSGLLPNSGP